jgi:hypothetical protein
MVTKILLAADNWAEDGDASAILIIYTRCGGMRERLKRVVLKMAEKACRNGKSERSASFTVPSNPIFGHPDVLHTTRIHSQ